MAGEAVAVFLRDGFRHDRLGRDDGGKIDHPLIQPDREIGPARLDAGQIFAAVELVDEILEVEVLAGLRVGELRRVAEGAVAGLARRAPVRPQGIVAGIARCGLRYVPPGRNFAAGGGELVKRVGGVAALAAGQLPAHHVGRLAVEIGRQRSLEGIGKNSRAEARESAALVGGRLQGLGQDRLARLAAQDVVLACDFSEDVVAIIPRAVFGDGERGDRKLHALRIEIVQIERFAFGVGDLERHHRPAIAGDRDAGDLRFDTAVGRALGAR